MPSPEPQQLRRALGRFATGVTVITCVGRDGSWLGLTANSFQSLSLTPPLVLWSLRSESTSVAAFDAAPSFAINVLAEGQVEVSRRFASREVDKFAEGAWSLGEHGAPVLAGCVATLQCQQHSRQVLGDHVLYVGEVLHAAEAGLAPLVFQAGHYRLMGEVL
jgi:flavin reductase (DIM6/NTAB) family NADH-FMN oxidoreductase RutF